MSEKVIQNELLSSASKIGARLFRNNTGVCWQGEWVKLKNGDVLIRNPRRVDYGLAVGSSDLVGWYPHKITMADVGKTLALFFSPEIKRNAKEKRKPEQTTWDQNVTKAGGISLLINKLTSPTELAELISDTISRITK